MMKNNKTVRIALSGVFLLIIAAVGVTVYRRESSEDARKEIAQEEKKDTEDVAAKDAQAEHTQMLDELPKEFENYPFIKGDILAPKEQETQNTEKADEVKEEPKVETENEPKAEDNKEEQETTANVAMDFSEESILTAPVSGSVLIDYSMDGTVYFPTLNQYKYNEAMILDAEADDPVQAAANGKISMVKENPRTGTTVQIDMGNGYETLYGQLKDVMVKEGQMVEKGTILGYIAEPTKYYVKEGPNLYFAMKKDGKYLDPTVYMENVTE